MIVCWMMEENIKENFLVSQTTKNKLFFGLNCQYASLFKHQVIKQHSFPVIKNSCRKQAYYIIIFVKRFIVFLYALTNLT
jgi:hypothetical protein